MSSYNSCASQFLFGDFWQNNPNRRKDEEKGKSKPTGFLQWSETKVIVTVSVEILFISQNKLLKYHSDPWTRKLEGGKVSVLTERLVR
jgi:hypothetical protein